MLLLTGTPERSDRCEKVAEAWAGPITFQTERLYTSNVYVKSYYPAYDPLPEKLNFMKQPDYNKMLLGK